MLMNVYIYFLHYYFNRTSYSNKCFKTCVVFKQYKLHSYFSNIANNTEGDLFENRITIHAAANNFFQ